MTTVPCPYCKQPVDPTATVCHHCHQTILSHDPGANAIYQVGYFILATILIFGGSSLWTSCQMDSYEQQINQTMQNYQ